MIALLTACLFLQSLCARSIASAKARAKTVFGHLNVTKCGSGQQAVCILKAILKHEQWNAYITLLNQYDSTLETHLFVCPNQPTPLSDFNTT